MKAPRAIPVPTIMAVISPLLKSSKLIASDYDRAEILISTFFGHNCFYE